MQWRVKGQKSRLDAKLTKRDNMTYRMTSAKKSKSPHFPPSKSFSDITVTAMLYNFAIWAMTPLHYREEVEEKRTVIEVGRCQSARLIIQSQFVTEQHFFFKKAFLKQKYFVFQRLSLSKSERSSPCRATNIVILFMDLVVNDILSLTHL